LNIVENRFHRVKQTEQNLAINKAYSFAFL